MSGTTTGTGRDEATAAQTSHGPSDDARRSHHVDPRRHDAAAAIAAGTPVQALCGHVWVPRQRTAGERATCRPCSEIADLILSWEA